MTWSEELHPRDESGRFASDGGSMSAQDWWGEAINRLDGRPTPGLPAATVAAMDYTTHYETINDGLRSEMPFLGSDTSRHIHQLDDALRDAPTMDERGVERVWRGVRADFAASLAGMNPGDTIDDQGFLSTSTRLEVARIYATSASTRDTILSIDVPSDLRSLDGAPEHNELVLPRDSTLEYVGRIDYEEGEVAGPPFTQYNFRWRS